MTASATSFSEQTDMVDWQKGTPSASAARAAWTSPRRASMPPMPMGARSRGMDRVCPNSWVDSSGPLQSTITR